MKTKRPGARRNQTLKAAVVEEPHQSGEMHKQFAFLADKPFASGGMKRLFREKHNIALHFSDSHDYYWTTFVYITVPSDKKPVSGIDPEPWLSPGSSLLSSPETRPSRCQRRTRRPPNRPSG